MVATGCDIDQHTRMLQSNRRACLHLLQQQRAAGWEKKNLYADDIRVNTYIYTHAVASLLLFDGGNNLIVMYWPLKQITCNISAKVTVDIFISKLINCCINKALIKIKEVILQLFYLY